MERDSYSFFDSSTFCLKQCSLGEQDLGENRSGFLGSLHKQPKILPFGNFPTEVCMGFFNGFFFLRFRIAESSSY